MRIKKAPCIVVTAFVLAIMCFVLAGCGGSGEKSDYDWPDAEIATMIPQPEGNITSLTFDDKDYLYATVKCDDDQYKEFIKASKDKGFTEDQDVSQSEDYYYFSAKNKEKYELSADYMDGELSISLYAPSDLDNEEAEATQAEETTAKKSSDSGKVSADFKKMMDGYEEFVDEYIAFMEKYEDSSDTASMMKDYTKFMSKYSEYMEKIDAVDEDELSDADLAYYLKVTNRVNEKLADSAL